MSPATRATAEQRALLELLAAAGDGAALRERIERLQALRAQSSEASLEFDLHLVREIHRLRSGLTRAEESQERLRALLQELTSPPLHFAVFLGWVASPEGGETAVVSHGDARVVVRVAEGVDRGTLRIGDEVLLGSERNLLVGRPAPGARYGGEVAAFERYSDGRVVIRSRDEELLVRLGSELENVRLAAGDTVLWNRSAMVAVEKLERPTGEHYFLEETPGETFADIGGLDRQIEELRSAIELHLFHPELVRKYRATPGRSVLLIGPPGTGKTLLARALANWLAQLSPAGRCRFMHIKPSGLHSMWYGQSEENYRKIFRAAREAGAESPGMPVVMFFDEVDSVGAARGAGVHARVDDRVITAFMAELEGLERRGNVLVVAATNRADTLDPAIVRPGRLGDLMLRVPRPDRGAARQILARHLPVDIPYGANGRDPAAVREEVIHAAVSRLYAPNADNDLVRLTFRDGRQRPVRAAELASGAGIAKIARRALQAACRRELDTGASGVRLEDLLDAVAAVCDEAAALLTPANCRQHLGDLPHDADVVRVEPLRRPASSLHRYLELSR